MESANEVDPCPAAVCQMSPQCSLGDTSMASNSSREKKKSDFCIRLVGPGAGVRSEKQVNKRGKDRWEKGEARKDLESWEGSLSQSCTPKYRKPGDNMCGAKAHIHTWQEVPRSKPQDSWHSVHNVTADRTRSLMERQ